MPKVNNIIETPVKLPANPPAGYKGGPGSYDGMPGYPGRTPSPNAAPEKFLDGELKPASQNKG